MSPLHSRNMKFTIFLIILYTKESTSQIPYRYTLRGADLQSAKTILNITADIIKDSTYKIDNLLTIKKKSSENAPFEIGYLMYTIQEKFRRMVDKYNTSHYMRQRLYLMELVLYLEEIEHHYWEIDHLTKMLHEIERKYHIDTELNEEYVEAVTHTSGGSIPPQYAGVLTRKTTKRKRMKMDKYIENLAKSSSTKKRKTKRWWPIEYGWEIDYYW
ncbi:unnamed protein product [Euphydryas editha]|uniref:Uncharacterized protein n=1 Tax=Euphydryas editha TaxID=104508 RepID=A0AAU9T9P9_EUPED|nr:unnamed protein product [Euphydryas editha]